MPLSWHGEGSSATTVRGEFSQVACDVSMPSSPALDAPLPLLQGASTTVRAPSESGCELCTCPSTCWILSQPCTAWLWCQLKALLKCFLEVRWTHQLEAEADRINQPCPVPGLGSFCADQVTFTVQRPHLCQVCVMRWETCLCLVLLS